MDSELAAKILQLVKDKLDTGQLKFQYLSKCGLAGSGGLFNLGGLSDEDKDKLLSGRLGAYFSREVTLPFLTYEGYCKHPHVAPACNRRISRTWCHGECIGQSCIFWGSEGIGTINLERSSIET